MKRISLIAIVMTAVMNTTYAYTNSYVGLGGGFVNPLNSSNLTADSNIVAYAPIPGANPSQFRLFNVNWRSKYDNGYEAFFVVGADFCPCLRGEIEFLYQTMTRNVDGSYIWREISRDAGDLFGPQVGSPIADSTSQTNVYSLLANGYYDFKNNSYWTPFLGVGLGVAWVNSSGTSVLNHLRVNDFTRGISFNVPARENSPNLSTASFAWQIKAGITYQCNANVSFVGQYRLFGTTNLNGGSSNITTNFGQTTFNIPGKGVDSLINNGFDLMVRYTF